VNDRGWASPIYITRVYGEWVTYYKMDDPDKIFSSMYLLDNGYREMREGDL